jgi:hypothetical protein
MWRSEDRHKGAAPDVIPYNNAPLPSGPRNRPSGPHRRVLGRINGRIQIADRLANRELAEAYAHCADRRDANGQVSLFTEDTHFVVCMNAKNPTPSMELHSREALVSVFADLNKYDATTHFVGQSTIFTLSADRGTGEAYCLAHHVTVEGGERRLMLASLRYLDTFAKMDSVWLFAERLL